MRSVGLQQLVQRPSSSSRISSKPIVMSTRGGSGQQQLLLGGQAGHPPSSWLVDGRRWPSPFRRLRGQVLLHCSQGRLRARRAGLLSPAAACCGADPHHKLRLIDYCALLVSAVRLVPADVCCNVIPCCCGSPTAGHPDICPAACSGPGMPLIMGGSRYDVDAVIAQQRQQLSLMHQDLGALRRQVLMSRWEGLLHFHLI